MGGVEGVVPSAWLCGTVTSNDQKRPGPGPKNAMALQEKEQRQTPLILFIFLSLFRIQRMRASFSCWTAGLDSSDHAGISIYRSCIDVRLRICIRSTGIDISRIASNSSGADC